MYGYRNAMLDLETLSTKPNGMILSVGIAMFDLSLQKPLGPTFYVVPDRKDQMVRGAHVDSETAAWWCQQSEQAREVFRQMQTPVTVVVDLINKFLREHGKPYAELLMWGNGSDFDNVLLKNFFESCSRPAPWKYHNSRCFRTLKNLSPEYDSIAKEVQRKVFHNAEDDARWQAEVAIRLLRKQELARKVCDVAAVMCPDEEDNLRLAVKEYEHA